MRQLTARAKFPFPPDILKELQDTDERLNKIIKDCGGTYKGTDLFKDANKIWIEQCMNKNSTEEEK